MTLDPRNPEWPLSTREKPPSYWSGFANATRRALSEFTPAMTVLALGACFSACASDGPTDNTSVDSGDIAGGVSDNTVNGSGTTSTAGSTTSMASTTSTGAGTVATSGSPSTGISGGTSAMAGVTS